MGFTHPGDVLREEVISANELTVLPFHYHQTG